MLCVNIDLTGALTVKNFIDGFIKGNFADTNESTAVETIPIIPEDLSKSIDEIIYATIESTISGLAIPPKDFHLTKRPVSSSN